MAGKRTRARRGNPKGKAYGFHGLRPAKKSSASSKAASGASTPSAASAPSAASTPSAS